MILSSSLQKRYSIGRDSTSYSCVPDLRVRKRGDHNSAPPPRLSGYLPCIHYRGAAHWLMVKDEFNFDFLLIMFLKSKET